MSVSTYRHLNSAEVCLVYQGNRQISLNSMDAVRGYAHTYTEETGSHKKEYEVSEEWFISPPISCACLIDLCQSFAASLTEMQFTPSAGFISRTSIHNFIEKAFFFVAWQKITLTHHASALWLLQDSMAVLLGQSTSKLTCFYLCILFYFYWLHYIQNWMVYVCVRVLLESRFGLSLECVFRVRAVKVSHYAEGPTARGSAKTDVTSSNSWYSWSPEAPASCTKIPLLNTGTYQSHWKSFLLVISCLLFV